MRYRITPRAAADLEEITDYLAALNPRAARQLVEDLRKAWRKLQSFPYLGVRRRDIAPDLRHKVVGNYVSLYRVTGDHIEIVRIFHGSRNITAKDIPG